MEDPRDKQWASKYLLDPLTEPQPGQETGPGTHFKSTFAPQSETSSIVSAKHSKKSRKRGQGASREAISGEIPIRSASDRHARPHRMSSAKVEPPPLKSPLGQPRSSRPRPQSMLPSTSAASSIRSRSHNGHRQEAFGEANAPNSHRRRTSSLGERYPGDKSHYPLDMIKRDQKAAHRAPHLRKKHQIGVDIIDDLDNVGGKYHHEGPFDATYYTRNTSFNSSPVGALSWSNSEALKATPKERILDSIKHHRPLDGVAAYPPGMADEMGRVYSYEEGPNMMIADGGNYKRWPGVKYLDEDVKGKGEPSYTIEKALKGHEESSTRRGHRQMMSNEIEMTSRPRSSGDAKPRNPQMESMWDDGERSGGLKRSSTTGGKLRRRLGLGGRRKSQD